MPVVAIAIHGGAGEARPQDADRAHQRLYRAALEEAVRSARAELERGCPALDVVVRAVAAMEDSGLYNAGRGSVTTDGGAHELDAAVMEGSSRAAGGVACVRGVRNPIVLARHVMEHSPHVLLSGAGAHAFARAQGVELVDDDYYRAARADSAAASGTVGAVALDLDGHLAAATSTGGTAGKQTGRIGDSPIVGAGTYAADDACAVSATGCGEYFVRAVAAHELAALVRYGGLEPREAVAAVLADVGRLGGAGGLIAVDRYGRVAMSCNTQRMYRASIDARGELFVALNG